MNINEIIAELVISGENDQHQLTRLAVDKIQSSPNFQDILFELVRQQVAMQYRSLTKKTEQGRVTRRPDGTLEVSNTKYTPITNSNGQPIRATNEREILLDRTVYVPGRERIPWGEVTIADLEVRGLYLREKLKSYTASAEETIEFNDRVAVFLDKNKVSCLNEVSNFTRDMIIGFEEQTTNAAAII